MSTAIVIGAGAGGSIAAMELAQAGWDVVVFEKGPNYFTNLAGPGPFGTLFANDDLKMNVRYFGGPDPLTCPRTWRPDASTPVQYTGAVDELPQTVGGGTVHWDAKVPRLWDLDFQQLSALGPQPGADMADWPFTYAEIAPYYDEIEQLLGTQGDLSAIPDIVLKHAPRTRPFQMPPGPQQRSSLAVAAGATALGMHPYPYPMAANTEPYNDQHVCNNCGFCSGYGCPVVARPAALIPLRLALRTGRTKLIPQTMVTAVTLSGSRATGVRWVRMTSGGDPVTGAQSADLVVLAASGIETIRLALLSGFPDKSGKLGRRLMLHAFLDGTAIFLDERMHAYRGRSITQCAEDACDPGFPGARAFAKQNGLPYIRGGIMELGGSQDPIEEGQAYTTLLSIMRSARPFGTEFKQLMRSSILRDRLAGCSLIGDDLPYLEHTVTLDPTVRDVFGVPVARITWSAQKYEQASLQFYANVVKQMMLKAGAGAVVAVPGTSNSGGVPTGNHVMGGMMMGTDPSTSVTDAYGAVHGLDNVAVADGSVFVTSGAHNPTNTIMAVALRDIRHLAGVRPGP
ncbi:MAG TPA: GMC family oxidoreductase [Streptosporangiaceae bacterium]|nr:GMC family oxidoreductase [Streptosporangiaceae bacterium]